MTLMCSRILPQSNPARWGHRHAALPMQLRSWRPNWNRLHCLPVCMKSKAILDASVAVKVGARGCWTSTFSYGPAACGLTATRGFPFPIRACVRAVLCSRQPPWLPPIGAIPCRALTFVTCNRDLTDQRRLTSPPTAIRGSALL